jgi:protein KRI1
MSKAERATKRQKFLEEDSSDEIDGGVPLLKVNEDYARRFEHNKKREELSRLEEKFKDNKRKRDDDSDNDSSSGSDEDDVAELATADLDQEIFATLQAIKNKDPRVYDPEVKFYKEFDPEAVESGAQDVGKSEKPMYLQDYHRQNYLAGKTGAEEDEEDDSLPVQTYQQEQDQLKRELVGSMHAAVKGGEVSEEDNADEFLVAKSRSRHEDLPGVVKKKEKKAKKITDTDIREADKDPETFLSNFMAARAWLPSDGARFQPLESDDSDEDARADEYEEAYNLRFEDPAKANEKLASFARDVGKYGVRREEKTGRAKARDRERELKEALKREREEDKARLRKLKIEQAEEKVKRIKEAAGLRADDVLDLAEWREVIDGDFEDDKWEEEMKKRFGEDYYAAGEGEDDSDDELADKKKKRKVKKPKWDDDIDIGDLVPDFDSGDKPTVSLSDIEDDDVNGGAALEEGSASEGSDAEAEQPRKKSKSKKDRTKEKAEAKRAARKQRQQIETLVDSKLPIDLAGGSSTQQTSSKSAPTGFRYRETSPTTFGLTPRDILFASDAALNNFAGLKKLAAFRDEERKKRERKKLSKKGRVKMWRRETFGREEPPDGALEDAVVDDGKNAGGQDDGGRERWLRDQRKKEKKEKAEKEKEIVPEVDGVVDGERATKKKKKRSKGGKGKSAATEA